MFKYKFIFLLFFLGLTIDSNAMENKKRKERTEAKSSSSNKRPKKLVDYMVPFLSAKTTNPIRHYFEEESENVLEALANSNSTNSSQDTNEDENICTPPFSSLSSTDNSQDTSEDENEYTPPFLNPTSNDHQQCLLVQDCDESEDVLDALANSNLTNAQQDNKEDNIAKLFELHKCYQDDSYASSKTLIELIVTQPEHRALYFIERFSEDVNRQDNSGRTALHSAVIFNQAELVRSLITHNADLNLADYEGQTPLHVAVEKNYKDIVDLLIQNSANLNLKNKDGNTPFHVAVKSMNLEMIQLFLNANADMHIENNNRETPLSLITVIGQGESIQMFAEKLDPENTVQVAVGNINNASTREMVDIPIEDLLKDLPDDFFDYNDSNAQ